MMPLLIIITIQQWYKLNKQLSDNEGSGLYFRFGGKVYFVNVSTMSNTDKECRQIRTQYKMMLLYIRYTSLKFFLLKKMFIIFKIIFHASEIIFKQSHPKKLYII
jgi:uncharacterized protein YneR